MHIFIYTYNGYKSGRLKSVFSKPTVTVANAFAKYMLCKTWEWHWCWGIAHWRRGCGASY